jgi:hypothetical protein
MGEGNQAEKVGGTATISPLIAGFFTSSEK